MIDPLYTPSTRPFAPPRPWAGAFLRGLALGAALVLVAACAYPGYTRPGGHSLRERPIAHPPPREASTDERESPREAAHRMEASSQEENDRAGEKARRTFPNEPGHAFFGEASSPHDFSDKLLATARERLAEVMYATAGLAIQRIRERSGKRGDWAWAERLSTVVRRLAEEAPRVWSYRVGRISTIVVEVRFHTLLQALLDELALDPDTLDEALMRKHEELGERPFAMRTVEWRRHHEGEERADAASESAEDETSTSPIHILAVGVTQPEDERFPRWPTARADAHALAEAFSRCQLVLAGEHVAREDWALLASRAAQTTVLVDEQASRKAIYEAAAEALLNNQQLLLLFAGHTLEYEGEYWLVPADASRDEIAESCLSLDELSALARMGRTSDREDGFDESSPFGAWVAEGTSETLSEAPRGEQANDERSAEAKGGRSLWVRWYAAKPGEPAVSDRLRGHGLFTYFLVRALRGTRAKEEEAPTWHSDAKLLETVRERVEGVARSLGTRQRPVAASDTRAALGVRHSGDTASQD